MLKVKQVAERLNASLSTIYALVDAGRIRCFRVGLGNSGIRVSEEQLNEYLESCKQGGKSASESSR